MTDDAASQEWEPIRITSQEGQKAFHFATINGITFQQVQELIDKHGDDIQALVVIKEMSEGINAQIDRELEIAQACLSNTFEAKRLEGSYSDTLPIGTSTVSRKPMSTGLRSSWQLSASASL